MSDHCEETRALERYEPSRSPVKSVEDLERVGKALATSGMFGGGTPGKGMVIYTICEQEGMSLLEFLRTYHVTDQGRITMRSDRMQAEFQARGGKIQWIEYSPTRAAAKFSYGENKDLEIEYTIKEAKGAGYVKDGSNWVRDPAAQLRARLITRAVRMLAPGVCAGVYTPEEMEDLGQTTSATDAPPDAKAQRLGTGPKPNMTDSPGPTPAHTIPTPPKYAAEISPTPEQEAKVRKAAQAVADALDGEILQDDAPDYTLCPIPGKMKDRPWSEMSEEHLEAALKSRNPTVTERHRDAIRAVLKEHNELPF
jgi:hypothetical protein